MLSSVLATMSNISWSQQDNSLNINQTSKHLTELKREIELEEEEIFANINELISGNSDLSFDDENSTSEVLFSLLQPRFKDFEATSELNQTLSNNSIQVNRHSPSLARSYSPRSARISPSITFEEETHQVSSEDHQIESDEHQFESDEHQYENDEQQFESDEDLQAAIQEVTSNLPKPCVFFLEGNCRRSDCKFSHDLSNITCKYWIEGFCFKGEMCPFLHSFNVPDNQDEYMNSNNGLLGDSGKNLEPNFTIESEADFPSLALDAVMANNEGELLTKHNNKLEVNLKEQILNSNPSVLFKTLKRKRKRG